MDSFWSLFTLPLAECFLFCNNNDTSEVKTSSFSITDFAGDKPVITHWNGIAYVVTSLFMYYFSCFRGNSIAINLFSFALRCLVLFVYVPVLGLLGFHVDMVIVAFAILLRMLYVGVVALKQRNWWFLLLNSPTLSFAVGKPWYTDNLHYLVCVGGNNFYRFGPHIIPIYDWVDNSIAVCGVEQAELVFTRKVELIDGAVMYVFTSHANVVSVVNILN